MTRSDWSFDSISEVILCYMTNSFYNITIVVSLRYELQ